MTVGELERRMTNIEYVWWRNLYAQEYEERRAEEREAKRVGRRR